MALGANPLTRLALAVIGALCLIAVASPASASGLTPVYGFGTHEGFALIYSQGLLTTSSVEPGSLVFGDTLYIDFIDTVGNRTISASVVQNGSSGKIYQNFSFAVQGGTSTILTLDLASSNELKHTLLCVDGGCERFDHQTPLTLIPSGILNIGGLDLLLFATSVEFFILVIPLTIAARAITRKALWTPKATLTVALGLPHLLFAFVAIALFDYPLFDSIFGGLEFLLFPVVFSTFYFVWVMHLFNTAEPALVLRPDPQGGHRLRFNAWLMWTGELADGSRVLVGTRWRDWLARLFGHYTVIVPANVDGTKGGGPAEAELRFFHVETTGANPAILKERLRSVVEQYRKRLSPDPADAAKFRYRPGRRSPLDDFAIVGDSDKGNRLMGRDRPRYLYWVDSDGWLDAAQPRLSFHRTVKVPAKTNGEGTIIEPATTKEKLAGPHYIDPTAGMRLARIHYVDTPVAALGWIQPERAYRRVEDVTNNLNAVRADKFVSAHELAEEQMGELLQLLERESRPYTDEEADEDTRPGPRKGDKGPAPASSDADDTRREKAPKDRRMKPGGGRS